MTRFAWTPEIIARLNALASDGQSGAQIAADIGCTSVMVYKKVKKLSIKLHGTGGFKRGRPLRHPFIEGDIAKIPLTKGKFATIDVADISLVSGRNWFLPGSGYASTCQVMGSPHVYLHRLLTGAPIEFCVDHKDGDPLNNRRENLRICTYQQNSFNVRRSTRNSSGKTGVSRNGNSWMANIRVNRSTIYLGTFELFGDAVAARLAAEKKYFGEFARAA